jgi:pilus assembly protein CpaB
VSSRRILILVLAIALAGVAAYATYTYLGAADERANQGTELVEVSVIDQDVLKGTTGEAAAAVIVRKQIPAEFDPGQNAIKDLNAIRDLVAVADLKAGTLLLQGLFVDPTVVQTTFSERLAEQDGLQAITVSVDQVKGVAGLIAPLDYVNLIVEVPYDELGYDPEALVGTGLPTLAGDTDAAEAAVAPTEPPSYQVYLLQKIQVLAVGQSTAPAAGEATPDGATSAGDSGLITFAVTAEQALKIAYAQSALGGMYLTLLPEDYEVQSVIPAGPRNLLDGQYVYY